MNPLRFPRHGNRQHGLALIALITLIGLIAVFVLVNRLSTTSVQNERDAMTDAALRQAKEALLGYAATHRDRHPEDVFGYFPLPDLGTSRNTTLGEGVTAGNFAGNAAGLTVIGRLPWKTLGLPPLRDGNGDCLWYAVSGSFQDQQQAALNWDSLGQFDVFGSDGTSAGTVSRTGANYTQRPVVVVISPGPPLAGQDRSTSATDTVSECGGNYDARNYLDPFTATANLNGITNYFSGTTNNATGPTTTEPDSPKQLVSGPVKDPVSGSMLVNDRLLGITPDEVFSRIRRRSDFTAHVNALLSAYATCLSTKSFPAPAGAVLLGAKDVGRLPTTVIDAMNGLGGAPCANPLRLGVTGNAGYATSWEDNIRYARCTSGECLTLNGSTCRAVLAFAGERSGAQVRRLAADKANHANYLESTGTPPYDTLTAYSSAATVLTADPAFAVPASGAAARDVAVCIKDTASSTLTFTNDIGSLSNVSGTSGAASLTATDTVAHTLTLGQAGVTTTGGYTSSDLYGCSWFGGSKPFGSGLRVFFSFKVLNRGEGFTLSVVDAATNASASMCGASGEFLGYAGNNGTTPPVNYPKIGLELDTAVPLSQQFTRLDSSSRHMALVYWGNSAGASPLDDDNQHGAPFIPPPPDPTNSAFGMTGYAGSSSSGFPLNFTPPTVPIYVRMDIARTYNAIAGKGTYTISAWLYGGSDPTVISDPGGMADTQTPFVPVGPGIYAVNDTIDIYDVTAGTESFKNFRIGFTSSQSSRDEIILINSFEARWLP